MKHFLLSLLIFWSMSAWSTADINGLTQPQQQEQFTRLTQQLRCLVCQNQNLADSNAPLAKDLRKKIATLIEQNATDDQIIHYTVSRYGDFIHYNPAFNPKTLLLWGGPFLLLLIGLFALLKTIKANQPT